MLVLNSNTLPLSSDFIHKRDFKSYTGTYEGSIDVYSHGSAKLQRVEIRLSGDGENIFAFADEITKFLAEGRTRSKRIHKIVAEKRGAVKQSYVYVESNVATIGQLLGVKFLR